MEEIEILEDLFESAKKATYDNKDEFGILEKRTEMLVRKIFGDESHYLEDLKNIRYSPMIFTLEGPTDWRSPFESGLKQFRTLIQVMIEDAKLSSNYSDKETKQSIAKPSQEKVVKETYKEIKVLIASPSDVVRERELLLDKLETRFRREHYEERCGARILVTGWEQLPSQSGYGQDIINNDLVKKSNIILAVFRHKLGSATIDIKTGKERHPSGTAEELLYAIRNKEIKNPPLGMAYFYSTAPTPSLDSIDFDKIKKDWDRLKEFKEEIKNEILYKSYKHEEEILGIVCGDICDNIIKYFK
jgi:hypothetical protein